MFSHLTYKLIHLRTREGVCARECVRACVSACMCTLAGLAGVPLTKIQLELPLKFGIKGVWTTPS